MEKFLSLFKGVEEVVVLIRLEKLDLLIEL